MMKKHILAGLMAALVALGGFSTVSAKASTVTNLAQKATIVVDGQIFAKDVPTFVKHHTTWMPINTVIQAITAMNDHVTYDGKTLLVNNLALQSQTLRPNKPGTIDIADGGLVEDDVPIVTVKSGSVDVSYVPVWYVMYALTQGASGEIAFWKHGQLTLENHELGVPSTDEIDRVMASAAEVSSTGTTGEHFVLTGRPVSITASNGDTVTAAVGTRSPSADGYGQVVFFFHNRQFVGLDSTDEKTQIRSIKPVAGGGMAFDVTYANYASSDALYNPTLPPATVTFGFNGTQFSPDGNMAIPTGASNGLRVQVKTSIASTSTDDITISPAAKQAVASALPTGASLLKRPDADTPYLAVDLNADGQYDYAAAYSAGTTGLIVVGLKDGKWQVLWNKKSEGGVSLQELNAGPMTGDGTESIAFQAYVGDGANDVTVLKSVKGTVQSVLHVAGSADIGDFNQDGRMEVANWLHDTGPLENVQLYAWNASKQMYEKAKNEDFPYYFSGASYQYDNSIEGQFVNATTPQNMLDYAWASTYLNMGIYGKAETLASIGLKFPSAYYPGKSVWASLQKTASSKQAAVQQYAHLTLAMKQAVDGVVTKYSDFYNAMPESTPLVTKNVNGTLKVLVIGTFDNVKNGQYGTATELSFAVNGHGLVAGSLTAKDAFGGTVWSA